MQVSATAASSVRPRVERGGWLPWALLLLPLPLALLALGFGRYPFSPGQVIDILWDAAHGIAPTTPAESLIWQVRLPRILAAVLIGAGLSGTGTAFQGIFKNPLVDSNLLGVTSGAGFGAALLLLLTGNTTLAALAAFAFGMLAVTMAYTGAQARGGSHDLMLTLSGILVGSFFSALISLVKTLADPLDTLPAITFWLLGGLSGVTWRSLPALALVTVTGSGMLILLRWRLNILSLGDREAAALGMDARRMKLAITGLASLMTAVAVATGGLIGWVGLVMPHAGRLLVGPDHRRLVPASLGLGGAFLLLIDTISRSVLPQEVPLGVFTGLVGVPILFWLLRRRRLGWEWN